MQEQVSGWGFFCAFLNGIWKIEAGRMASWSTADSDLGSQACNAMSANLLRSLSAGKPGQTMDSRHRACCDKIEPFSLVVQCGMINWLRCRHLVQTVSFHSSLLASLESVAFSASDWKMNCQHCRNLSP